MPRAQQGEVHYHYQDHDTDLVSEIPPVQNTWYECFDAEDVRLLWCVLRQNNDETVNKDIEVRWTIDGNVYLRSVSCAHNSHYYIYRAFQDSTDATGGLSFDTTIRNTAYTVDKRGKTFKVEVRITSVLGTNQALRMWCVRETETQT